MAVKTECMIRLDDITPDMDWERFNRAKVIFDKYGIKPLIGVVPDNRDATLHKEECRKDFWETVCMLQKEGWIVAQHGTYHVYVTKNTGILGINPFSEFAGLSYEEQITKLKAGQNILKQHGVETDIFMAPGHTFDRNTLKALKECGFGVVTDGLFKIPYYAEGILCIPCRLRGFNKTEGIDTVCLHTNLMSDSDMDELEEFCRKYREEITTFEPDRYREKAGERTCLIKLKERQTLAGRKVRNKIANSKRLAWYLNKTNHKNSKVKWLKRLVCLPLLFFYRGDRTTDR